MGIWIAEPTLSGDETIRWQRAANRAQGIRAVGGRLYLTQTRLFFEPNRIDALTGGQRWYAPLAAVRAVGSKSATGGPFDGGLRRRLQLDMSDGSVELFVVNGLEQVVETLRGFLGVSG